MINSNRHAEVTANCLNHDFNKIFKIAKMIKENHDNLINLMGTSKNTIRHAELVSASPNNQGIAGQARNDERMIIGIFRSPLMKIMVQTKITVQK